MLTYQVPEVGREQSKKERDMNLKSVLAGLLITGFGLLVSGIGLSAMARETVVSSENANAHCFPVDAIDEWRAYDDDTMSVFGEGREIARIDITSRGPSNTWIMRLIHKVRFEAGDDGLLCPEGKDTLVLDGRRHLIERIDLIDPHAKAIE